MMKNKLIYCWLGLLATSCGDVPQDTSSPGQLDVAMQKVKLCQDITEEKKALEVTHFSESAIDRKSKFPCTNVADVWNPIRHKAMKEVGFFFKVFRARNYKPNSNQQRLEIIFNYEDSWGLQKMLSYSCEMNDEMKEWAAKTGAPEC